MANGCGTIWETLYGGPGGDVIQGHGRTVTVYGEGDSDWVIDSGDSTDSATMSAVLYGGDDYDELESSNGLGTVMYGGDDMMWGDADRDTVAGNDGTDALYGGSGEDTMCAGDGTDSMWGGNDDDVLQGDISDSSYGEGGTDTCDLHTTVAMSPSCNTLTWLSYQCGSW